MNEPALIESCERIRRMLTRGEDRQALQLAKELYVATNDSRAGDLLLDAYEQRCKVLRSRGMDLEAGSIAEVAIQRFPAARERFERLRRPADPIGDLVAPLADANLNAERRSAIEAEIERSLTDLAGLAATSALPEDHSLRAAAKQVHAALDAATTRPVADDEVALNGVPRRSPLAQWKLLIRAIALFHRGDNEGCARAVDAMKPGTAAARAIPALRSLMAGGKGATPAHRELIDLVRGGRAALRRLLEKLEDSLAKRGQNPTALVRDIGSALRGVAGPQAQFVKRHVYARCVARTSQEKLKTALGGLEEDSEFCGTLARRFQFSPDMCEPMAAANYWVRFLRAASKEGRVQPDSLEAAIVHREIAELLTRDESDDPFSPGYAFPGDLDASGHFAKACGIDPSPENYMARIAYLKGHKGKSREVDAVLLEWHAVSPRELEPLMELMRTAHRRKAFQKAMSWLKKAEDLDPVHAEVRRARIRILAANVLQSIRQGKAELALTKIASAEKDPASQPGDRPAVFAAFRHILLTVVDPAKAAEAHAKVVTTMGDELAAATLIYGLGVNSSKGPPAPVVTKANEADAPRAIARAVVAMDDVNLPFRTDRQMFLQSEIAYKKLRPKLAPRELETLAKIAIHQHLYRFAYDVSGDGLALGEVREAYYLFVRSQSLLREHNRRSIVVLAAAMHLARERRDQQTIAWALETEAHLPRMTMESAQRVLREERKAKAYPTSGVRGPDYSDLIPPSPFSFLDAMGADDDDDDDDDSFDPFAKPDRGRKLEDMAVPPGMPPEVAKILFEAFEDAARHGASPEDVIKGIFEQGIFDDGPPGRKRRRRR